MIDDQLNEIEARAKAATPGPWEYDAAEIQNRKGRWIVRAEYPEDGFDTFENGEFCAHAREDVPALIAEVLRLRALLPAGS